MLARIRKVTDSRDAGASAVEYGLLVAAIAAAVVVVVFLLGDVVLDIFSDTCGTLNTETSAGVTGASCAAN